MIFIIIIFTYYLLETLSIYINIYKRNVHGTDNNAFNVAVTIKMIYHLFIYIQLF